MGRLAATNIVLKHSKVSSSWDVFSLSINIIDIRYFSVTIRTPTSSKALGNGQWMNCLVLFCLPYTLSK